MGTYSAHNQRMRQVICDAMAKLLDEKPFSKITVADILSEAQIQRATFYRYFRDKYEAAEAVEQALVSHLVDGFFAYHRQNSVLDWDSLRLFDAKYRHLLPKMLGLQVENINLSRTLLESFSHRYRACYPDADRMEAYLAAANFISLVVWFSREDMDIHQIVAAVSSDTQARWMARFYGIPAEPLLDFIRQNQAIQP